MQTNSVEQAVFDGAMAVMLTVRRDASLKNPKALTFPQIRALTCVARSPGCSLGHLAHGAGVRKSAACLLVDRLVASRYVARSTDPSERRVTRLTLTPAGRRALEKARLEARNSIKGRLKAMTPAQRRRLADAMTLLVTSMT